MIPTFCSLYVTYLSYIHARMSRSYWLTGYWQNIGSPYIEIIVSDWLGMWQLFSMLPWELNRNTSWVTCTSRLRTVELKLTDVQIECIGKREVTRESSASCQNGWMKAFYSMKLRTYIPGMYECRGEIRCQPILSVSLTFRNRLAHCGHHTINPSGDNTPGREMSELEGKKSSNPCFETNCSTFFPSQWKSRDAVQVSINL